MTEERFIELISADYPFENVKDGHCSTFEGLKIIDKYCAPFGIEGADHDIVYSVDVDQIAKTEITEEEVIKLAKLGWFIYDDAYLAHHA